MTRIAADLRRRSPLPISAFTPPSNPIGTKAQQSQLASGLAYRRGGKDTFGGLGRPLFALAFGETSIFSKPIGTKYGQGTTPAFGISSNLGLGDLACQTGAPMTETRKKISLVDSKGLTVSSRKESLQHFKQPWAHEHKPVKDLIGAVNAIRPQGLYATKGIGQPAFGPSFGAFRHTGSAFGPSIGQFRLKNTESGNFLTSNSFVDAAKVIGPSVVRLDVYGGPEPILGSGFLVDTAGTIITCAHNVLIKRKKKQPMLSQNQKITVTLNGEKFNGVTTNFDHLYDVAIVKVDLSKSEDAFSPAKLGFSSKVQVGDMVFAYGYSKHYSRSLTMGIISSVSRTYDQAGVNGKRSLYFQTDCATTKGNSGCPLVNLSGEVVGVVAVGIPDLHRVSFAVPIDTVRERLSLFEV